MGHRCLKGFVFKLIHALCNHEDFYICDRAGWTSSTIPYKVLLYGLRLLIQCVDISLSFKQP